MSRASHADHNDGFESIVAELGDFVGPTAEFAADGLPAGADTPRMWRALLGMLEAQLDEEGWDAQPRLFVVNDASSSAHQNPEIMDALRAEFDGGAGLSTTGYLISEHAVPAGHPRDALVGMSVPPGTAALILATEAWMTTGNGLDAAARGGGVRPSQDPRRLEIRQLTMVTRAGRLASLARVRGYGPHLMSVHPEPMPQDLVGEAEANLPPAARRAVAAAARPDPDRVPHVRESRCPTMDDPSPVRARWVTAPSLTGGDLVGLIPERLALAVGAPHVRESYMRAGEVAARLLLDGAAEEFGPLAAALDHPEPAVRRARLLSLPDVDGTAAMLADVDAMGDGPSSRAGGRKAQARAARRPVNPAVAALTGVLMASMLLRRVDELHFFVQARKTAPGGSPPHILNKQIAAELAGADGGGLDTKRMFSYLQAATRTLVETLRGEPGSALALHPGLAARAGILPAPLYEQAEARGPHGTTPQSWIDWWQGLAERMLLDTTGATPSAAARHLKGLAKPALLVLTRTLAELDPDLRADTAALPWPAVPPGA